MKLKEWWNFEEKNKTDVQYKKKIIALGLLAILLGVGIYQSVLYVSGQGGQAALTEREIQKEKDFINQYKREENIFNEENLTKAQPVSKSEVDSIQNDLLQKSKNYQLDITLINNMPATAPANIGKNQNQEQPADGIEFEIGFYGTWESTVQYIRDMQRSPGLLSIRSLAMKPKQNSNDLVETNLKYKIYLQ